MDWSEFDALLDAALDEDSARRDVTTAAIVPRDRRAAAELRAKEPGVVCGLPLAARIVQHLEHEITFVTDAEDGERVEAGRRLARLDGPAAGILSVERTLLNFLQRLSGIATFTARFVDRVAGTGARIYDTRKTTPGWRRLEKYAVRCGGGYNHRMHLGDMVLIKENHLALMTDTGDATSPISAAVMAARSEFPGLPVEVEVESEQQLRTALRSAPDIVMLDNMTPQETARCVALAERSTTLTRRPQIEASGLIDLQNVREYAETGVDRIAIGSITHSAPAMDLSLYVIPD